MIRGSSRRALVQVSQDLCLGRRKRNKSMYRLFFFVLVVQNFLFSSLQGLEVDSENSWQFDTLRVPSSRGNFQREDGLGSSPDPTADDSSSSSSTIKPHVPAPLPSSLRLIFGDEGALDIEPLRVPVFPASSRSTPSPPSLSSSPTASRDRAAPKRAATQDASAEDVLTAKQPTFAFPTRPRTKSRLSSSVPDEDAQKASSANVRKERPPPLGPGIPRGRPLAMTPSATPITATDEASSSKPATNHRGAHINLDIDIPSFPDFQLDMQYADNSPPITSSPTSLSFSHEYSAATSKSRILNRKRSQSIADGLIARRSNVLNVRDENLKSSEFQFPLPTVFASSKPLSPAKRTSPTHATSASTSSVSYAVHQSTQSLDTSGARRQQTSATSPNPSSPTLGRMRSATTLAPTAEHGPASPTGSAFPVPAKRMSLTRQASVAVMETVPASPVALVPPVRPFVRDRTGSDSSINSNLGLPGLKDVLKVRLIFYWIVPTQSQGYLDTFPHI
jgi:protein-serine/threonine kinase